MSWSETAPVDSFVSTAEIEHIAHLDDAGLDALPFGAIKLALDGTILSFNQYEVALSGRRRERVLGRSFFDDVAPCTNVREFAGRFREGIEAGYLNAVFPYVFDYKMAPRHVVVTLAYHGSRDHAWVFVREQRDA